MSTIPGLTIRPRQYEDPNCNDDFVLQINDFNIEGTGAKSTGMANLVKQLKAEGVPIDGIGIQTHLIVGEVPTTLQQNIQDFVSLGVEVAITELDIHMNLPYTPILAAQQTEAYKTVISACKAVSGCIGVTVWDWTDKAGVIICVGVETGTLMLSCNIVFLGSWDIRRSRRCLPVGCGTL